MSFTQKFLRQVAEIAATIDLSTSSELLRASLTPATEAVACSSSASAAAPPTHRTP